MGDSKVEMFHGGREANIEQLLREEHWKDYHERKKNTATVDEGVRLVKQYKEKSFGLNMGPPGEEGKVPFKKS
ncbi:hypothetical protein N7447_007485 [Penicillium robsamsonii]|uniref:uncharacterized protein n=1 Tax=Penicillium robsamsonii TaxID=1792511 RepID=UPI00254839A2|nr:uncharacterized protein N7447_007485 [Penicillium robsamsonii]KAJ5825145.1 hypothetical protein N7447_007485 [Penicillium robsamsonii]